MKYYRLVDSDDYGLLCTKANLYDFDRSRIFTGQPIVDWDDRITLGYEEEGDVQDYLGNMVYWPVVSERLRRTLEAVAPWEVQFHPLRVVNWLTGVPLEGYYACNILNCVPALHLEKARYFTDLHDGKVYYSITHWAFHREVASRFRIFRPAEDDMAIVVSDQVRVALVANEITGVDFREVKLF